MGAGARSGELVRNGTGVVSSSNGSGNDRHGLFRSSTTSPPALRIGRRPATRLTCQCVAAAAAAVTLQEQARPKIARLTRGASGGMARCHGPPVTPTGRGPFKSLDPRAE
jgi:hypothetical protein